MGRKNIIFRIIFAAASITLGFLLLAARVYHVQLNRHEELFEKARGKYVSEKKQAGERGQIYDINGNLLVGNMPCSDIIADPKLTGDENVCREMAADFSRILGIKAAEVYKRLNTKTRGDTAIRYAPVMRGVDLFKVKKLEQLIHEKKYRGIIFENKIRRYYPKNELCANILGFTNMDEDRMIPVIGIEKAFDKQFTPTRSSFVYERDRRGIPLAYGKRHRKEVRNGLDLYLTIHEPIQTVLEEELDTLVREFNPESAYAVMIEPFTGNVYAMAQRPTFNPNDRSTMKARAWRDRLISDAYEPGSVMKPIIIAGGLDCRAITPGDVFFCENGYWPEKKLRDAHPEGSIPVWKIIQVSSNIGAAKIAMHMGESRVYQTLKRFGLGRKTGISIQPEATGILRKFENWDSLSVTRFPIGQGISVSLLQLARAYCAIANGGKLVRIRLIDGFRNRDTGEYVKEKTEPAQRVILRKSTHRNIVKMLELVPTEEGTAGRAAIPGYTVAGKTGTAQKWVGNEYSNTKYTATFIGFVPADKPAFVLLIMADEPEGSHYGGVVAAPTFRRIAKKTLKILNVLPDNPDSAEILK